MKLPRRKFLHLAASAATLPAVLRIARAQAYPTRPVRIVIGFPAGSATDIVARLIAQSLSERLGQQFIVDNRPGAGSNIAAEVVVRAEPDGYTLLALTVTNAVNATLYEGLNFDIVRDIAPIVSHLPVTQRHGGKSVGSRQNASRVHRLRQGQSGQDQLCVIRLRERAQRERRAIQDDDRRRPGSRPVSRQPSA